MSVRFVNSAPVVEERQELVYVQIESGGRMQTFAFTPHAIEALRKRLRIPKAITAQDGKRRAQG